METEIKFKQEFEDKLNELGVREQFVMNVIKQYSLEGFADLITDINSFTSFYEFITASFVWDLTPEGWDFWRNIAKS